MWMKSHVIFGWATNFCKSSRWPFVERQDFNAWLTFSRSSNNRQFSSRLGCPHVPSLSSRDGVPLQGFVSFGIAGGRRRRVPVVRAVIRVGVFYLGVISTLRCMRMNFNQTPGVTLPESFLCGKGCINAGKSIFLLFTRRRKKRLQKAN